MRTEYTKEQKRQLRITEIYAILENNLYADKEEEQELIEELKTLEIQSVMDKYDEGCKKWAEILSKK